MVRQVLPVLLLLALVPALVHGEPTVAVYSFTPDLAIYGPDVQVQVRMQMAGGEPQSYRLLLQSELNFREWKILVDGKQIASSAGSLDEIEVPALASMVNVSLNGSTPNLVTTEPRVLFRAQWKDGAGVVRDLKTERRQVGQASVAPTPASTPTPTPAPTPASTTTPIPPGPGTLKVVVEPPGLTASIFVDGKFGGSGAYQVSNVALGQYLVSFGDFEGYEKPASQVVTLSESQPFVLLTGQYRAIAATPTPPPSATPASAVPEPTPAPPAPAVPGISVVAAGAAIGVLAVAGTALFVLRKRKTAQRPEDPPSPEAPPPEPAATAREVQSIPEEVPLETLRKKKEKLESKKARLEEQKGKGEVGAEEYEEKKKRYERELEELDKELAKRSS